MLTSFSLLCFASLTWTLLSPDEPPAGEFKKDPVALLAGQELAGVESISVDRYRYRYWFADEANKAEFLAHPEKYEIQLGGACARMGPLSGWGQPGIHAIHDGRLYIFASPQCRETFLSSPEKFLDHDDPVATGSELEARLGKALLMKAVQGLGGAERVEAATGYEQRAVRIEEYNEGEPHEVVQGLSLAFPAKVRNDYRWDGSKYSYLATGETGWYQGHKEPAHRLHPQQVQALHKHDYWRNPLAILKARNEPGFIAISQGSALMPDGGLQVSIEKVTVSYTGTTATLGIQSSNGRILSMTYRGPGPNMSFGTVEKRFSDFKEIDGLTLPTSIETLFEGEPVPKASVKNMEVKVNVPFTADHFQQAN